MRTFQRHSQKYFLKSNTDFNEGSGSFSPSPHPEERSDEGSPKILQPFGLQDDQSGTTAKNTPTGHFNSAQYTARFRFFGNTNDFLPRSKRKIWFTHSFKGNPAIKDAIESLGVPHTEVDGILVDGKPKPFLYQLTNNDKACVYSDVKDCRIRHRKGLKVRPSGKPKFILDSHLGKLARYLRLFGFDALYRKDYVDHDIMDIAKKNKRIVLTRDIGLLKHKIIRHGYWVRSTDPKKQIPEVIKRFNVKKYIRPFHLCLECNGRIVKVRKKKIMRQLPQDTKAYFHQFCRCLCCKKIYWRGSHYEKLFNFVETVKRLLRKG